MINRREFLGAASAAAALPPVARGAGDAATQPPNVIWLFGDQHRAQALGVAGDPNAHTPVIDNLARAGVHFTTAVSGFPLCCPFRGSLLTSRYPHHCVPGNEYSLPLDQPTIVQPLKQAGYHTAYFGKWHLDGFHEREGRAAMHIVKPERRRGFDQWIGYENNNSQYDCWVHGGAGKDAFHYRLPGYETDELTNLLIRYIGERAEEAKNGRREPFFAVLSVQPPHDPFVAPPEYAERYNPAQLELRRNVPPIANVQETARRDLAGYYAMIQNWDWNIGRVRAALQNVVHLGEPLVVVDSGIDADVGHVHRGRDVSRGGNRDVVVVDHTNAGTGRATEADSGGAAQVGAGDDDGGAAACGAGVRIEIGHLG
jgi:arylsulfatase A-like enzyme